MTFEELKNYFEKDLSIYYDIIPNKECDICEFCKIAIEDLEKKIKDPTYNIPTLQEIEIDYAAYYTLYIIYYLVADKISGIDEFSKAWQALYSNYLDAFYLYKKEESHLDGMINLLDIKNNMQRLIFLSDYIIFKKRDDSYSNISSTFVQSIINNRDAKIDN